MYRTGQFGLKEGLGPRKGLRRGKFLLFNLLRNSALIILNTKMDSY